eukprot:m.10439 g.10439  ORF g.10439 m.10439 type:complete len:414 (+) comp6602_c0_seq1:41-1282(+)
MFVCVFVVYVFVFAAVTEAEEAGEFIDDAGFIAVDEKDVLHLNSLPGGSVLMNNVDVLKELSDQDNRMKTMDTLLSAQEATLSLMFSSGALCSIDVTSFPNIQSGHQLLGDGVLGRDGNIYVMPGDVNYIAVIRPQTNEWDTTSYPIDYKDENGGVVRFKWGHGVLANNGNIYGIGGGSKHMLIFDPVNGTVDHTSKEVGNDFVDIVLSGNGKLYAQKNSDNFMLIFDPLTGSNETVATIGGGIFSGMVVGPDDRVYCIPDKTTSVLIFDPATNTTDRSITIPRIDHQFSGGVLAPNGLIYAIPAKGPSVGVINPFDKTADYTSLQVPTNHNDNWTRGVYIGNGKIIALPSTSALDLLIIDTFTNTVDYTSLDWPHATDYRSLTIGADGRAYAIPHSGSIPIAVIDPLLAPCK